MKLCTCGHPECRQGRRRTFLIARLQCLAMAVAVAVGIALTIHIYRYLT